MKKQDSGQDNDQSSTADMPEFSVKRHWQVPEVLREAVRLGVGLTDMTQEQWVTAAIEAYLASEEHDALTAEAPRPAETLTEADLRLPESALAAIDEMRTSGDSDSLNVWIADLATAGWPIRTVLTDVLGVTRQRVSARAERGREIIASGRAAELDLPPVPAPPLTYSPPRSGSDNLVDLVIRVRTDVDTRLHQQATAEHRQPTFVVEESLVRAVRSQARDVVALPLQPVSKATLRRRNRFVRSAITALDRRIPQQMRAEWAATADKMAQLAGRPVQRRG